MWRTPNLRWAGAVSSEPAATTEVGFSVLSGLGRGLAMCSKHGSEHHVYTILTLALCCSVKSGKTLLWGPVTSPCLLTLPSSPSAPPGNTG